MGSQDDLKLRSCMRLFSMAHGADPIFAEVLERFFDGQHDEQTIGLLER